MTKLIDKKIKVIHCEAFGKVFDNLIPNSEHIIIEPPFGYKNDKFGIWVMGVGEPVRLLSHEYKIMT